MADAPGLIKTTLRIKSETHSELKLRCTDHGFSMADGMEQAVALYLATTQKMKFVREDEKGWHYVSFSGKKAVIPKFIK